MIHFADRLLQHYGYGAITLVIAVECAGLLFPGETIFFGSAIYASTTGRMNIVLIIAAAVAGAIIGNVAGFGIGRLVGAKVLVRHGARVGLSAKRLALGRYLFRVHGGKVVFFCRFVSVLRSFNALMAGASAMPWRNFLLWTVLGGVAWPALHGMFAYALGNAASRLSGRFQIVLGVATVGVVLWILRWVKRNEVRLEEQAMRSEFYDHHA